MRISVFRFSLLRPSEPWLNDTFILTSAQITIIITVINVGLCFASTPGGIERVLPAYAVPDGKSVQKCRVG